MDDTHRLILQRYRRRLADDMIVTDRFLAQLVEEGIFESGMVNIIKGEKTESDQIYKLLDLLPKRGPEAFGRFVDVLEEDYPWLADLLLKAEPAQGRDRSDHGSFDVVHKHETPKQHGGCDPDIKKLVGTFVHRQFGHSKRVSEKDKKNIEVFLADQLQQERSRYQAMLPSSTPVSVDTSCQEEEEEEVFRCSEIQEHLVRIYIRMDVQLSGDQDRLAREDQILPDDLTFEVIYTKLDKLVEKIRGLEGQIARCLGCFEPYKQSASLFDLVTDMRATNVKTEKEVKAKGEQVDKLLEEVQSYSDHIDRLEKQREDYRRQVPMLQQEIKQHRQEKANLLDRISQLERINRQHVQKNLDAAAQMQAAGDLVSIKAAQEPLTDAGLKRPPLRRSKPVINCPSSYRRQSQSRNVPKNRRRAAFTMHTSSKY